MAVLFVLWLVCSRVLRSTMVIPDCVIAVTSKLRNRTQNTEEKNEKQTTPKLLTLTRTQIIYYVAFGQLLIFISFS